MHLSQACSLPYTLRVHVFQQVYAVHSDCGRTFPSFHLLNAVRNLFRAVLPGGSRWPGFAGRASLALCTGKQQPSQYSIQDKKSKAMPEKTVCPRPFPLLDASSSTHRDPEVLALRADRAGQQMALPEDPAILPGLPIRRARPAAGVVYVCR